MAIALLAGCSEPAPVDPLDPEVVQEAAEAEGDARGAERSGTFAVTLGAASGCDCPPVMQVDLCVNDLTTLAEMGGAVTLTQSDGFLVLTEDMGLLNLSGALQASGEFDVAGIYGFGSVLGELGLYVRLVGRFTSADRFTGTVASRALGDLDDEDIDCRNDVEVIGTRIPRDQI